MRSTNCVLRHTDMLRSRRLPCGVPRHAYTSRPPSRDRFNCNIL